MGNPARWCGFPAEMSWMRSSGDGCKKIGREKYKRIKKEKCLIFFKTYDIIYLCDIFIPCSRVIKANALIVPVILGGQRPEGGARQHEQI